MAFQGRLHGEDALGEGGAADAVQAGLGGVHPDHSQAGATWLGQDDPDTGDGYRHGRLILRSST